VRSYTIASHRQLLRESKNLLVEPDWLVPKWVHDPTWVAPVVLSATNLTSAARLSPPLDPAGMPAVPERWIRPQEIVEALRRLRVDMTPAAVESFRAGYAPQWADHESAALEQLGQRAAYIGAHAGSIPGPDVTASIAALYAPPPRVLPLRLLPLAPPALPRLGTLSQLFTGESSHAASLFLAGSQAQVASTVKQEPGVKLEHGAGVKQESSARAAAPASWARAVGSTAPAIQYDSSGDVILVQPAPHPWSQAELDALDAMLSSNPSRSSHVLAQLLRNHHRTPGANHLPFPYRSDKSVRLRATLRRSALGLVSSYGPKQRGANKK
jgi:hypothetical protein